MTKSALACSPVPSRESRGNTQRHLWAQKFNRGYIGNDQHLEETIAYIRHNRKKHGLPPNKELQPLIDKMIAPIDQILEA